MLHDHLLTSVQPTRLTNIFNEKLIYAMNYTYFYCYEKIYYHSLSHTPTHQIFINHSLTHTFAVLFFLIRKYHL